MPASDLSRCQEIYRCDMRDPDYAENVILRLQIDIFSNLLHHPSGIPSCTCSMFGGIMHDLPVAYDALKKARNRPESVLGSLVARCPGLVVIAAEITEQSHFKHMPASLAAAYLARDIFRLKKLIRWMTDRRKRGGWR